jgi:hypothetical protein
MKCEIEAHSGPFNLLRFGDFDLSEQECFSPRRAGTVGNDRFNL